MLHLRLPGLFASVLLVAGLILATPVESTKIIGTASAAEDAENVLVMELKNGEVRLQLRPDLAPNHVERLKVLTRQGFYDGVVFHRVIAGFMAQTGDPTGTGTGGSDLPDLKAEFTDAPFVRGVLGMARSRNPNSANSQFFITYANAAHLNGQYTVFGEVIDGMEVVDKIKKGPPAQNGIVSNPDKIIRMRVAADIK